MAVGVVERGKAKAAAAGRKKRQPVQQPVVRPDLSGALMASVRDVAAYTNMSRSAISKAIGAGKLRVVRVGRTVHVRVDSVHEMFGGPPADRVPGPRRHAPGLPL